MKRSTILTKFKSHSSGQITALLVVGSVGILTVMVGAAALVTDMGNYYYNAFRLQSAVDAAVMSGAHSLPCPTSGAASTATSIAQADGVTEAISQTCPAQPGTNAASLCLSGTMTCTSGSGNNTITMAVKRAVPFYFGRAVGVNQGLVSVSATAQVGGACSIVSPNFWVAQQACGPSYASCPTAYYVGETLSLTGGQGSGSWPDASGDWGSVRPPAGNTVSIGQNLTPEPGNGNGSGVSTCGEKCILNSAQSLIDAANSSSTYSGDTALNHSPSDPRAVAIPLVDWSTCSGGGSSCSLSVVGFAEIWINCVIPESGTRPACASSSDPAGSINATFITQAVNGQFCTTVQCVGAGAQDVGTCTVKLTS
jgi:Putative Flp pilus-assembly TadE/G-like